MPFRPELAEKRSGKETYYGKNMVYQGHGERFDLAVARLVYGEVVWHGNGGKPQLNF